MIKLNCKAWLIESKHGKGVSDILVGVGNKLYFVEAKTYSDLSTEQEDFLDYDRTFAVFIKNNKTIFFKKDKFTKPQAIAWAKNHGFDYANSYDENKSNYIFRCNDKNAFKKHTYRTIELKESGIKIIIGVEKMEQGGSVDVDKMNSQTDKIAELIKKEGYDVSVNYSSTDFGRSNYIYVYDSDYFNNNKKLKIRISDHSVSNYDRIFNEYHISYPIKDEEINDIVNGVVTYIHFEFDRNKYFDIKKGFDTNIVLFETKEFRPETDTIVNERLTKKGEKIYNLKRKKKVQTVEFINKKTGKIYRKFDRFTNNGVDLYERYGLLNSDEYKQGGSITQNTIKENRKQFMMDFKEGGEVKKKVARRNLPLNTTYKIIDSFYTGGLFENPHICENCGKPIANVGVVENEKGEHFEVGMDCAKTLSGIDDDLKFTDAEDDFKKANQIRQKINKAKKNESLNLKVEITSFKGNVVIEAINKKNNRYEFQIASEPQDFIEKYMPDVLKMVSNKEKIGYKPIYTKIKGFDFSKVQRKGNEFEYSFDNVKFKIYDLEIKSNSGMVNSHIAFNVYINGKLIGKDTTYDKRDVEGYILGIINKYYFEKYDNLYRKTTKTDTEILQGGLSDNKTILDIPTYEEWFSNIKFNTVGGYVLPDGTKGIGKKTNEEWFKKLYNKRFKQEKEILQGGVADKKTIERIAKEQGIDNLFYAYAQLKKGIAVELEHTDNDEIAREIALDNLSESIDYYIELEKMEEKLNNIKLSSNYTDSQLLELCKQADINKETLVFDVEDDKVEYYKSLGFVVKQ